MAQTGQALEHFVSYIQERSPRKRKAISIYDPFGINNQWGGCPTLSDVEMLDGLEVLNKWRQKGFCFDYYVPDWGWTDHTPDLKKFASTCFPHGPDEVVKRVEALGMKFGLWFAVSNLATSDGTYPAGLQSSMVPSSRSERETIGPAVGAYRNGYPVAFGMGPQLCVASEPYFSLLRDAVLYHVRENHIKFFKLDIGNYYCNSTTHQHLPGKYSVEAMYGRLLDIARAAREADPDIYLMWYWGVRSPFFALHGDSIFESGLYMEGSGTSWFPTLYYRDSVTLNLDQSTQFAKATPPINKDSLGVWLADTRWGNFMGNERWKEGLIMDLGRGNLLFPQIWGDIYLLNDRDVNFLADMTSLVKKNEALFLKRNTFGDPWKNEVYGYAYFLGPHGFLFVANFHFASRKAAFNLGPALGMKATAGAPVQIISHFPERNRLIRENGAGYKAGETAEVWVRPFEILMLEVTSDEKAAESLPVRQISSPQAANLGVSLSLESIPQAGWMAMEFADQARFRREGERKKAAAFASTLPSLDGDQRILAIAVRLRLHVRYHW